MYNLFIVITL